MTSEKRATTYSVWRECNCGGTACGGHVRWLRLDATHLTRQAARLRVTGIKARGYRAHAVAEAR